MRDFSAALRVLGIRVAGAGHSGAMPHTFPGCRKGSPLEVAEYLNKWAASFGSRLRRLHDGLSNFAGAGYDQYQGRVVCADGKANGFVHECPGPACCPPYQRPSISTETLPTERIHQLRRKLRPSAPRLLPVARAEDYAPPTTEMGTYALASRLGCFLAGSKLQRHDLFIAVFLIAARRNPTAECEQFSELPVEVLRRATINMKRSPRYPPGWSRRPPGGCIFLQAGHLGVIAGARVSSGSTA